MPEEQDDQPDRDAPYMDPSEYLTTRHIIEAEFGNPPRIPMPNFDDAVHRIEVAVEVLGHQCGFTDADLYELIRVWSEDADIRNPETLTFLRDNVRAQILTRLISYLIDKEGDFFEDATYFAKGRDVLASLRPGLRSLPPLQTVDQFNHFGRRVCELNRHHSRGIGSDISDETRRIDVALIDIIEAFRLLGNEELERWRARLRNQSDDIPTHEETLQRHHDDYQGVYTHPDKPPRSAVVSNVMERGDEIAKSAAESVQAMRIVLSVLEERRSNDPAENELKEQLAMLIKKIGEARDATEKAAETGAIEDAEVAAETIEKSKTVWDDAVRRMVDIGLNSAGAISCFAVALGATATFTAAGFAIPPLAALTVSAGFFGVSAVMDNLPGAKGTS